MRRVAVIVPVVLVGCIGMPLAADLESIPVYFREERPPASCVELGSVDGSIHIEHGSPKESQSLGSLRAEAMASSKHQVVELGGDAYLLLDLSESDYSDRSFTMANVGIALRCN